MTLHRTGPGIGKVRPDPKSYWIYNFDIDGDQLKAEHKTFLVENVIPILNAGGSVRVIGLTDRLGATAYNQGLSERRVTETVNFLKSAASKTFTVAQQTGFGELLAEKEGELDGSADEKFRAVLIFTSSTPTPPPPPPPPPPAAPTLVNRITERTFIKIETENDLHPKPSSPVVDLIFGLGGILAGQLAPEALLAPYEQRPPKTAMLVSTLRVNKVVITTDVSETMLTGMSVGTVTVTTTRVTYTWGVPAPTVIIETRYIASLNKDEVANQTESKTLPRAEAESKPFVVPPDP